MKVRLLLFLIACLPLLGCRQQSGVGASEALFVERFTPGEIGNWHIEGDALSRTAVIDDQLIIEVNAPQTIQFTTLQDQPFDNFVAEVDVRQLRGNLNSSFGILFRMQGPNQFYRFEITGEGNYILERRNADGTWTRFVEDWTPAEAINQGINTTNRLKVTAVDRSITVYVNDIQLTQISDNLYANGTIALDAGTFVSPELKVAFDNFTVSQPQ